MIVQKGPKAAWRTIQGEGIILALDTKLLRGLNPVGTRIWELIDGQRSVEEIARQIAREFTVEPDRALADARAFIQELLSKDLVAPVGPPPPPA